MKAKEGIHTRTLLPFFSTIIASDKSVYLSVTINIVNNSPTRSTMLLIQALRDFQIITGRRWVVFLLNFTPFTIFAYPVYDRAVMSYIAASLLHSNIALLRGKINVNYRNVKLISFLLRNFYGTC